MNSHRYFFPKLYGDKAELHSLKVKSLLEKLHKEYYERYKTMQSGSQGGGTSTYEGSDYGVTNDDECEMKDYNKFILNVTRSYVKPNLETYLDEECLPVPLHSSTNILKWWNHNKYKYPIMSLKTCGAMEDFLAYSKLCLEHEEQGPSSSGVSETFEKNFLWIGWNQERIRVVKGLVDICP
ncbi:hypothetical protein H6P81_012485 [Aristolochia fimbriata]|uniref:HAT C-terminal dimerisation domain-containing protein n=1 Tax=Aristolochia fimbriata TaxID=158543 RepID=A0AAV7EF83_ARIFI|nr:hypothetical protein H6P81_012485 [Aristolochia fimbriata]